MSITIYVYDWHDRTLKPGLYTFTRNSWVIAHGGGFTHQCAIDGFVIHMKMRSLNRFYTEWLFWKQDHHQVNPDFTEMRATDQQHCDFLVRQDALPHLLRFNKTGAFPTDLSQVIRDIEVGDVERAPLINRDKVFCLIDLPPLVIAKVLRCLI